MKKQMIQDVVLITLYVLFLHASAYSSMYEEYISRRNIFIFLIVAFLLIINRKIPKIFGSYYWNLWYAMSVFVFISVFPVNISMGIKIALVPLCYGIIQYDANILRNLSIATLLEELWILYQSLTLHPVIFGFFYKGVYDNSNTFGASMLTLFLAACNLVLLSRDRRMKIVFLLIAALGLYYEFLSFCRSAMVTSTAVTVLLLLLITDKLKKNKSMLGFAVAAVTAAIILLAVNRRTFYTFLYAHIYKWGYGTEDLSSSRTEMWKYVFTHPTLLGTVPQFDPHSNYVKVFYDYGSIAGCIFILFCATVFWGYMRRYRLDMAEAEHAICLMLMVSYISMGLFEESFGFTGKEWMFMGYVGFGYAIRRLNESVRHTGIRIRIGMRNE